MLHRRRQQHHCTDHGEGSLRILIQLSAEQGFKAADRVLQGHVAALKAGELLRYRERLREILLHPTGTVNDASVVCSQLLHAEDGDDVLKLTIALQKLLCAACDLVMPLADNVRLQNARGGIQRIYRRQFFYVPY